MNTVTEDYWLIYCCSNATFPILIGNPMFFLFSWFFVFLLWEGSKREAINNFWFILIDLALSTSSLENRLPLKLLKHENPVASRPYVGIFSCWVKHSDAMPWWSWWYCPFNTSFYVAIQPCLFLKSNDIPYLFNLSWLTKSQNKKTVKLIYTTSNNNNESKLIVMPLHKPMDSEHFNNSCTGLEMFQ